MKLSLQKRTSDAADFADMIAPNIRKTVGYFVSRGFLQNKDKEDMEQELFLYMLENSKKILSRFQGRSSFQTYLISILHNRCINLARGRPKSETIPLHEKHQPVTPPDQNLETALKSEFHRLGNILELHHRKKSKLILCLKLIFRISVSRNDFVSCFPEISAEEIDYFVLMPVDERVKLTDKQIYTLLTPLLNRHEQKTNTPDAVRRWVDLKIDDMILSLNGSTGNANYNHETFQILFEKYCERKA